MNSYNYSYNVLINRLEAFAAGHFLIKRFTHGQIDLADQLQDDEYPFMHVVPEKISPVDGGMQFDFLIVFADIPRDKEYKAEYQREVISDCVRLGQDLIAEVKNGLQLFGFDVQLANNPTFEPFMEEQKNTVTGVSFVLSLEVPYDWSACDIPAVWSIGGSSSGGTGTGYGITLQTNGINNEVQNLLNLVAGSNINITDNGDGSITFDASGGGTTEYVSTEWNANHATATGNPYAIGDRVWYNGSVYQCIANNDGINPSNPSYWTLLAVGNRLRQTPVDWNATSGDYQILNKPIIPTPNVYTVNNGITEDPSNNFQLGGDLVKDTTITGGSTPFTNYLHIDNLRGFSLDTNGKGYLTAENGNDKSQFIFTKAYISSTYLNNLTGETAEVKVGGDSGISLVQASLRAGTVFGETGIYAGVIPGTLPYTANMLGITTPKVADGTAIVGQVLVLKSMTASEAGRVEFETIAINEGTVTSVALSTPSAFNVSGSPITTSGTISISGAGTTAQYVDGTGALQTMPTGLPPTGTAGGDLAGTYPNPTVDGIHGIDMQSGTPTTNDVWVYGGSPAKWQHQHVNAGIVDNDSAVTGTTVKDALNHLNTTKVEANAAISASTATKITYDAKGLVTAGTTLAASDMPSSIDAAKIGSGAVSNAEFGYLDGVTSSIQTQLDSKVGTARTISTTSPLSGGGDLSANRTLSIADAAADGSTKGAAAFTAADFNSASGVISLDYTNAQKATAAQPGFLTAADWTTFNSKPAKDTTTFVYTNTVQIGASTTIYMPIAGSAATNATESFVQVVMPYAGTIKNLYLRYNGTQSNTGNMTITTRKNGVNQTLAVTLTNADGALGTKSDTTNSFSVAAGDLISIVLVNSATATSGRFVSVSLILERS